MKREIELLAPGGDLDSIKAAILAGAVAIYCGLDRFNARGRAKNITFDDLNGILRLAHQHQCKVFLTVNILIVESEFPALVSLLNKLVNTTLDGIIVQDIGLFYLLTKHFPSLEVHASTQLTTHNRGQIKFLHKLGATRVNLSRELNLEEIAALAAEAHANNMLTEVFVHGSNCISFSGLCYMSSLHGGNSGNRGRCSQPCRDQYLTTAEGKDFPLNMKDNSAFSDLPALYAAGVDSLKIEGRIKKYHYVYTVVEAWRRQLDRFYQDQALSGDDGELRKVFNRDFSNAYLRGSIGREVFIDNPRDNSVQYQTARNSGTHDADIDAVRKNLSEIKEGIVVNVKEGIDQLSCEKAPLSLVVSGECGEPLRVSIKTPDQSFEVASDDLLTSVDPAVEIGETPAARKEGKRQCIDRELLLKRFKALNNAEYVIAEIDMAGLGGDLFIPFKQLTTIRDRVLSRLHGAREAVATVSLPALKNASSEVGTPRLMLLTSSQEELPGYEATAAEVYFQLPNSFQERLAEFVELLRRKPQLTPWFPAVLIGEDYEAALSLLQQVRPARIVTSNTGIAYEAYRLGIKWLAGPYMNLVNSYSLICLKETLNCSGAFLSNELNREQLQRIKRPEGFDLFYSIYHPVSLMTTRVCMFHQVTGCKKNIVDERCMQRCEKSSFITNMQQVSFFIDKARGEYHGVYNEANFLNVDIVSDLPSVFAGYLVDLRAIKTATHYGREKPAVIEAFEGLLHGNPLSAPQLKQAVTPTTCTQYVKGIVTIQHFFSKTVKKCLTGFLRNFVFFRTINKPMQNHTAKRRTISLYRHQYAMRWPSSHASCKTPSAHAQSQNFHLKKS